LLCLRNSSSIATRIAHIFLFGYSKLVFKRLRSSS